jgi:hypothetical protein
MAAPPQKPEAKSGTIVLVVVLVVAALVLGYLLFRKP